MSNFYQLCLRFPPPLVRLLARKDGRAMTTEQIGKAAEMTQLMVELNLCDASWDSAGLDAIRRITRACNLDFTSPRDLNRVECYLRKNKGRPTFKYLTKDPNWKTYYLPLIVSWRKSLKTIPKELPEPIRRLLEGIKI
jgi:hypothetical protein